MNLLVCATSTQAQAIHAHMSAEDTVANIENFKQQKIAFICK